MVINLKFLKKTWKIFTSVGLIILIYTTLFVGAISLFSLANKNTIYYGNRCVSSINEKAIEYLNQPEIIAYDYSLQCNTLYLDLNVEESLNESSIKAILVRISNYYESINFSTNTHISIKNSKYLILASLINYEISLSVTHL